MTLEHKNKFIKCSIPFEIVSLSLSTNCLAKTSAVCILSENLVPYQGPSLKDPQKSSFKEI